MKIAKIFLLHVLFAALLSGCGLERLQEGANQKFGDQHFKTAISLIELHKVRYGSYPESLDSLQYTGDWDALVWSSVQYEKLDSSGYALDLVNGWVGKPKELEYPSSFWQGLGLVRSNMKTESMVR